jgi:hypothetical protein
MSYGSAVASNTVLILVYFILTSIWWAKWVLDEDKALSLLKAVYDKGLTHGTPLTCKLFPIELYLLNYSLILHIAIPTVNPSKLAKL